jgi:hypothetical protein
VRSRPFGRMTGFILLCVPFIWTTAGLALTEAPTLLATALFVYSCMKLFDERSVDGGTRQELMLAAAAGVALGVAILARQLMVISVAPLAGMMLLHPKTRKAGVIIVIIGVPFIAWYYHTWGGLLPSNQQYMDEGLRIEHLVLGLAYTGISTLIMAPRWLFDDLTKLSCIIIAVVGAIVGWSFLKHYYPGVGLIPRALQGSFRLLIGAGFGIFAALWTWRVVASGWKERHLPYALLAHGMALVFAMSAVTISHQFSSRYILFGIAFMPIIAQERITPGWFTFARICLGVGLGAVVLLSYHRLI